MADLVSKISWTRSAAVIASWAIAKITPSAAIGQTSDSIRMMKATSVPEVIVALADGQRAQQQHDDQADVGDDLEERPERDDSRTFSHRRVVERRACAARSCRRL